MAVYARGYRGAFGIATNHIIRHINLAIVFLPRSKCKFVYITHRLQASTIFGRSLYRAVHAYTFSVLCRQL